MASTSICSELISDDNGTFCISKNMINKIKEFNKDNDLKTEKKQSDELISDAAKLIGVKNCDKCVISSSKFVEFMKKNGGEKSILSELIEKFKPEGPRDSKEWLSSSNIDEVLDQWMKLFTGFYNYRYNTIDFYGCGGSLAREDILVLSKSFTHLACVVNTDTSRGPGKHWVCLFVDIPGKSVEFFNSSGSAPLKSITLWMTDMAKKISAESVVVSKFRHQFSSSECGVYCLFYIRKRLEGIPYKFFSNNIIKDDDMIKFRKNLFSPEDCSL